jgi:hypothetical protein
MYTSNTFTNFNVHGTLQPEQEPYPARSEPYSTHISDMHISDMHISEMHISDMHISDMQLYLLF